MLPPAIEPLPGGRTRVLTWLLVAFVAFTVTASFVGGPAGAQTATGTTAPTTPPTTSPTSTTTPPYGNEDPCAPPHVPPQPHLQITITSPANGSTASGTVTITGTVARLGGAPPGTVRNDIYVQTAVSTFVAEWQGEGSFSIPWQTDDGRWPDGRKGVTVTSRIGDDTPTSAKTCVTTQNGLRVGLRGQDLHPDPRYVNHGELMVFRYGFYGESTFRPEIALVPVDIDQQHVVTLQVTPRAWATATGGYAWEVEGTYQYRTFQAPGHHQLRGSVTLNPQDSNRWEWSGYAYDSFEVLHSDYGPTTTPPTSTGTSGPTSGATHTATTGAAYTTPAASSTTPPTTGTYAATPDSNAWIDPSALGVSSVRPLAGEAVTIYVRVQNPIETPVTGSLRITVDGPDGTQVYADRQDMRLGPREYEVATSVWRPAADGNHLIRALFVADNPEGSHIPASAGAKARIYVGDGPTQTPILVMSAGLVNIGTLEEGSTRTVPVEVTAYNQHLAGVRVLALDPGSVNVRSLTPPTDLSPGQSARFFIQIEVPELGDNQTLGSQSLIVLARAESVSSNIETLNLVIHREGFEGLPYLDSTTVIAAAAGTGAVAAFFRDRRRGPPL